MSTQRKRRVRKGASPSRRQPAAAADDAPPIPRVFPITSVDQLRSLALPIRQRILNELAERPMTTKQVALKLGQPVTRLYHHVDALAEAGLIKLVRSTPKRGTIERFYRAVASSFRADESCFGGQLPQDERLATLLELLDSARNTVLEASQTGTDESLAIGLSSLVKAAPSELPRLVKMLTATIQKWADAQPSGKPSTRPVRLTLVAVTEPESGPAHAKPNAPAKRSGKSR
jgi:DNA-binding transcriptional ArsR family regulator